MPHKLVCFWLEPTDLVEVTYRRYTSGSSTCTATRVPYPGHLPVVWGYHNEEGIVEAARKRTEPSDRGDLATDEQKLDPRWPKKCACGYEFVPEDMWQVNTKTLYMASNDYGLCTLNDAPAGAMYDARWMGDHKGPDGRNLVLKTPEGDWWIDGPADNGPGWKRTGIPPIITCTPSIRIGNPQRLHGWLRSGVLEIDFP